MVFFLGGNLKTTAQADKESLQAQFYDLQDIYSRNVKLRYFCVYYVQVDLDTHTFSNIMVSSYQRR